MRRTFFQSFIFASFLLFSTGSLAVTLSFSAAPISIAYGGQTTLTWSSTDASLCRATGAWSGTKAVSGQEIISGLTVTSKFTLTCRGLTGGSVKRTVTATVVAAPMPTVQISANPLTVASGGVSTLTWSSTDATACTASGAWSGGKALAGSQTTASLTATGTYTLTCSGGGGSATQSATVTVLPPGGVSNLSGTVDSSLIASNATNAVYVYSGNVTPDDVGGSGAQAILIAPVVQDSNACTWRYDAGSLADGEYTLAFTKQAANDFATTNDAITFSGTTLVSVSGGVATYNFPAARVLRVGSGKTYASVLAAAAAVQNGDVIEIDAGQYDDNIVVWRANDLTLRGVGGRAHMYATKLIPYTSGVDLQNGKAIWVTQGTNIKVENIEFSNAMVPDKNGAGIRAEGAGLSVCNGYFHNNENGILGGNGEMLIEYSEFAYNGGCPAGYSCSHNLYITLGDKLIFRHNYSHHASSGHTLKTRAKENHILYNRIMDEADGTSSYTVDVPDGGLTYLIGNLLQQGPLSENWTIVSYAAESASNPVQELYAVNNTFVNDRNSGYSLVLRTGTVAQVINNRFVGVGTAVSGSATLITNLETSTSAFVNQSAYDYRLTSSSSGIDGGSFPSASSTGFSLTPVYQYVHPNNREARPVSGALDIGAYEYSVTAAP